jgi:hypothetical protein
MRTVGATGGNGEAGVQGGGRLRGKLLILRLTGARILAWAAWWQAFGVQLLQEVDTKRGKASGQVR